MSLLGRDDAVVSEWLLKADQFKGELKDLAKEIQAQQRHEKQLELVRKSLETETAALSAANRNLSETTNTLANHMSSLNDALGRVGYSMPALAGGIAGIASAAIPALVDGVRSAISSFNEFIASGDDFNDEVGDSEERVLRMAEAAQHFIGSQEALRMEQKLSAGQLQLTEDQYEGFARAVTNYSHAMKVSGESAAEALTDAYLKGSTKAFKPLGVDIKDANTLFEKQEAILREIIKLKDVQLTQGEKEQARDKQVADARLEAAAKLAGGIFDEDEFQNRWAAFKARMWKETGDLAEKMSVTASAIKDDWNEAMKGAAGSWVAMTEFMGREKWDLAQNTLQVQGLKKAFEDLDAQIRKTIEAAEDAPDWFSAPEPGFTPVDIRSPLMSPGMTAGDLAKRNVLHGPGGKNKKKTWSGGKKKPTHYSPSEQGEGYGEFGGDLRLGGPDMTGTQSLLAAQNAADGYGASLREAADAQSEFSRWVMQSNGATVEQQQQLMDAQEVYAQTKDALGDLALNGVGGLAAGMWEAADAALTSGESFGAAMAKMLKATLMGVAQQATVKAIFELAEGFATLGTTWGIPNPASVAHFTAAGIYAGVAAVAGGAGLAMSAAGVGRESNTSTAVAGASRSSNDNGYKPSFGSKTENNQPIYINLYLGDPSDSGAVLMATKQIEARLRKAA